VLDLQLARVYSMSANAGLRVEITPEAKEWLLDQNTEPEFGARPIRRIVQDFVQDALVDGLTDARFAAGDTIRAAAPADSAATELAFSKVTSTAPAPATADAIARPEKPAPTSVSDDSGAHAEPPCAEAARKGEAG
jgi:ATP-dependent Clp protease ATP-binding subunit ClpC